MDTIGPVSQHVRNSAVGIRASVVQDDSLARKLDFDGGDIAAPTPSGRTADVPSDPSPQV